MKAFDRIGQLLGWIATKTSVRRVAVEDKMRHEKHGGSSRDLYDRAAKHADRIEKMRV